jgi:hypothetical protein
VAAELIVARQKKDNEVTARNHRRMNRIRIMEFKKPQPAQNCPVPLERGQAGDIIPSSGLGVFFLARISGDVKGSSFPYCPSPDR